MLMSVWRWDKTSFFCSNKRLDQCRSQLALCFLSIWRKIPAISMLYKAPSRKQRANGAAMHLMILTLKQPEDKFFEW